MRLAGSTGKMVQLKSAVSTMARFILNSSIDGVFHRKDGPAHTRYNLDGSIHRESFCIAGELLGYDKAGFWAL